MSPAGRPPSVPQSILDQMIAWRDSGCTLNEIAQRLNEAGVPTPGGSPEWYAQNTRQVILAEKNRRQNRAAVGPKFDRELNISLSGIDDDRFSALANAIWFLVKSTGPEDWALEFDGVSAGRLRKAWRDGPNWS